jgi:hypothetical protein
VRRGLVYLNGDKFRPRDKMSSNRLDALHSVAGRNLLVVHVDERISCKVDNLRVDAHPSQEDRLGVV